MTKPGAVTPNPWTWGSGDYVGLGIYISVSWNANTRSLTSSTVSRDAGCQYNNILIGDPTSSTVKTLPAPADGQPANTYNANQMSKQGLNTIDDVLALQITASP